MRLDKFLSTLKYGSRTEIKRLCKTGKVEVNNIMVKSSDMNIDPSKDVVKINGEIVFYKESITLIMNKPKGYICSNVDEAYPSLLNLLQEPYNRFDFSFAGRLDQDTSGLVVLSTDGNVIHQIASPKKDMYKVYYVKTLHEVHNEVVLESPIILKDGKGEEYTTKGAKVTKLSDNELLISICEGKFHQVKRMLEYINNKVIYLKRVKIGNLELPNNLLEGHYIEIDPNAIFL